MGIGGKYRLLQKPIWHHLNKTFVTQIKKKPSQLHNVWESVIGLEIHAQINTRSKLFSSARNRFMEPPNFLVSDFDAALPGTFPVLNKNCVEAAVFTSLALNCKINMKSYFDRKHYFYADLPQGYQITQQRKPIAVDGHFPIPIEERHPEKGYIIRWKNIGIEQIQLEQDSGKSLHDDVENSSLIDLNRAGVGLMEIVTSPDFSSSEEAATFVTDLQLTMMRLGTCCGKVDEGQLRVDANISIRRPGEPLGVRSEVKNIAGIRGLQQAIEFEISRQRILLESGQRVVNETRDFNAEKGITISMRDKGEFQDYRFMPEPNLPPLILYSDETLPPSFDSSCDINIDDIRRRLPHPMPVDIRRQLVEKYDLSLSDSTFLMENGIGEYFVDILVAAPNLTHLTVFDFVRSQLLGVMYATNRRTKECPVSPKQAANLLVLLDNQDINSDIMIQTFNVMVNEGGSPEEIIDSRSWRMIKDISTIEKFCDEALKTINLENMLKKYIPGKHKRPKNKKAVSTVVTAIIELSKGRAHTKIAQNVARHMLDKLSSNAANKK
uniref:glutamyl-tRNA(Gln) amidotransferase subunit B, mitochondrial-like isoform X1 n=2 Tax=Styela clava TaxID=7725 RepID=UPI00193959D2|nr:glutamyl-tRNA(Gln) amidotransferase subunit B, mitochondrial-like isoform X1 [Styela clava]